MTMIDTAAAANTGSQRAASHKESGKNNATMTSTAQASLGRRSISAARAATQTRASRPSAVSRGGGRSRAAENNPIIKGAIVMMPSASDTSQLRQMVRADALDG